MKQIEVSMKDRFGSNFPDVPLIAFEHEAGEPSLGFVPRINENYHFPRDALGDVLNFLQDAWGGRTHDSLQIMGPTGSGKTSLVQQVCARLGAPVMEITGHGRLEVPQLLYSKIASEGSTMTLDGPITTSMDKGYVCLFNEIDLVEPETLTGLNDIVEYQRVVIEDDGRLVEAAKDLAFAFIATSNTGGGGDETGFYAGTKVQNLAFRDRFRKALIEYPDRDAELALLKQSFPILDPKLAERFVDVANLVRDAFSDPGTGMDVTMSTRNLIRWIGLTADLDGQQAKGRSPVHYALDRALAFGTSAGVYESLHQMVEQTFGVPAKIAPVSP